MTFTKLLPVFGLLLSALPGQVPATLAVDGIGGTSVTMSLADLAKLPQQTVKTGEVVFEGVLVSDVLAKVELPLGEKFHKTGASYYLLVEAKDGYRAVFAWAEMDATFMDKPVYLVTKRDGKPLSEKDGPFQLLVPGEKRGGRSVRLVTALRVKQAK